MIPAEQKNSEPPKSEQEKTKGHQKKIGVVLFICFLILGVFLYGAFKLGQTKKLPPPPEAIYDEQQFGLPTQGLDVDSLHFTKIEIEQEENKSLIQTLIESQKELQQSISDIGAQQEQEAKKTANLIDFEVQNLKNHIKTQAKQNTKKDGEETRSIPKITSLVSYGDLEDKKHVSAYIPAGSIVQCVIISGVDCSAGVLQATNTARLLLRPLENAKLPLKVRVAIKNSILLAEATADLSRERINVRISRLSIVHPNGDFVETEVAAYVSGEDGREGIRGVVVDRSGQTIARAFFATFFQSIGQSFQAVLNNQTISKLSNTGDSKTLLNVDTFRNSGLQGVNTSVGKLSEYLIKRAEQIQPVIQVGAGRIVDVIFLRGVKIGEKDLAKTLEIERELKRRQHA